MEVGRPPDEAAAAAVCSSTSSKVGGGVLQQLGTTPAYREYIAATALAVEGYVGAKADMTNTIVPLQQK